VRNPRNETFDELIVKIFKVKIYSNEGKSLLERTRKSFTDFRNKFNQNILNEINEYKNIRRERYFFNCFFNLIFNKSFIVY
jgi:hypothetical protein